MSDPISRRELLKMAGAQSAALLVPLARGAVPEAGAGTAEPPAHHAVFATLAPGAVAPEGWLRLYLGKQARELARQLPTVSWPFTGAYWAGEQTPPAVNGWWPWEQKAYWTDGALRCALVLKDPDLLKLASTGVEYTLAHAADDGYLGPAFLREAEARDPKADNCRWPHNVFFRALAAYSDASGDRSVAFAVRRHFLADQAAGRVRYSAGSRDVTAIEGLLWAYQHTADPALLAMAEGIWKEFLANLVPGEAESGDLHPDRVFANTPIHAHGVTYIEVAKLPALLYSHTGDARYLEFALAAQNRIFTHHMLIDGMPSTEERYGSTTALDAHETCDIVDHTWSWGYLLMATGDGIWADRIERACFNAGMGALRKDWKAIQYFSSPNQVLATHESNHVPFAEPATTPWMSFSPNPGHRSACCSGNVHRLLPNYVIRMWMTEPGTGALVALLYGASRVSANVGRNAEPIEIEQQTDYPFEEEIRFTVRARTAVTFPLVLRVPGWCAHARLTLNEQVIPVPPVHKGFIRLERTFAPGDRLVLTLPMQARQSYWPDRGLGVEHGPLVYALRITEQWSSVVVDPWSTAKFPEWDALPMTPWNYGILYQEPKGPTQLSVRRRAMTEDPWVDPPVTLTVPLVAIPEWALASQPEQGRKLTPALPRLTQARAAVIRTGEPVLQPLVPYGATHLRVSVFPHLLSD